MLRLRVSIVLAALLVGYARVPFGQERLTNQQRSLVCLRSVILNGSPISLDHGGAIRLKAAARNVRFEFGENTNLTKVPTRICCRLEGYEDEWHIGAGEMFTSFRFYDDAGDIVGETKFPVAGHSADWTGSWEDSPLTHRRETVLVPPRAAGVMPVISSAGPPQAIGTYVVANMALRRTSPNASPKVLLQSPYAPALEGETNRWSDLWRRDGSHRSMAKIVKIGANSALSALAILDDDKAGHAEWHAAFPSLPAVTPGDRLEIEWDEMFSIGIADFLAITYPSLPTGNYRFRLIALDVLGRPLGEELSIPVIVLPPLWQTTWFLTLLGGSGVLLAAGVWRYLFWRRMQREVARLKSREALELERLRIAQDIHDDLGARVTEISLMSATFANDGVLPAKAREGFQVIKQMSQELVGALSETVWAVNPEYDNLAALGDELCQTMDRLCAKANVRCRLQVQDLPAEVHLPSRIRHNLMMVVKEAANNIIKHANASEAWLQVDFSDRLLEIIVCDNGVGLRHPEKRSGHGISNMKSRMESLGGTCEIESNPGNGTLIRIRLRVAAEEESTSGDSAHGDPEEPNAKKL